MPDPRRVVVCAGRGYARADRMFEVLGEYHAKHGISMLGHGACCTTHGTLRGGDGLAELWAIVNQVPYVGWPAQWDKHGRAAGPRRNADLLEWFRPDVCIAFPGGNGTAGCVAECRRRGIEVVEVDRA